MCGYALKLMICSFSGLCSSLLCPDRTFMQAWICTDDVQASHLQAKGRRCYLSQNIGLAVTRSAGLALPPLFMWCLLCTSMPQTRLLSQVISPSSWTQTQSLTLLCSPSPAPPLVVLSPLSPGGGMAQYSVMAVPTISLLKWQIQWQPPTPTHWQWLGDWRDSISAVYPTSGHLQEVPEA